ncbi:aminodeoxychorismate lyase [Herbiconiux daphne]|uniref:Aminodeoxychorismate lyase n=1 Tax=Herbiconiux daphne TaxID=2970914 RepID=A0ABT2H7B0_9MICO|nr:aminodeoxychorismate lyase [Herbiconiux daphne]MCS5735812.1 aminodeoxychorismate lyase [Herbiconiux daphne]
MSSPASTSPAPVTPVVITIARPSLESPPGDEPLLRVHPFDEPVVDAMNLGITRGDGIFETVGIVRGAVHGVDDHLQRFARSARILELPEPDLEAYRAAVELGIEHLGDVDDAYCKYVYTRGIESRSWNPTGYAFLDANPDWTKERTTGIAVVTLTRGYALDVAQTAPWLLQGAKTLSYGVNRAVLREAARRGADDVVFTTSDGYALEGPTSTLVLRYGDHIVTPSPEHGVLLGTAQLGAFAFFESRGFSTEYRDVRADELADAEQLWLTNSQRLAAPIHRLDGRDLPIDAELTAALNDSLRRRRS